MSADPGAQTPDEHHILPEKLLGLIASRDADALSQLYDLFSHALRCIALRVLADASEADDVLQEVFIKVWDRAAHYSAEHGAPATWLITITRNTAINRLRARSRNHAAMERAAAEPALEAVACGSAYDHMVSAETAAMVRKALADLPEDQRTPLELAYLYGLTYEEVAERLGHPLGSVKSRVRRGMARMKISLSSIDSNQP